MKKIEEILKSIRPEFDFAASEDFISDGMLDSLDVVTLVATLDETFAISVEGVDILPENLKNIEAIQKLLEKYGVTI